MSNTTKTITASDRRSAFIYESATRGWDIDPKDFKSIKVDGNRITFEGTTVWCITEAEATAAGVNLYDVDAFPFKGNVWVIFPC